jgi:hypothetical protein
VKGYKKTLSAKLKSDKEIRLTPKNLFFEKTINQTTLPKNKQLNQNKTNFQKCPKSEYVTYSQTKKIWGR